MTSRVLEIDGQFLYIPGCMIIAFGDQSTHTSDMQLVKSAQGVDLGKLHDTHLVYKNVVHDIIGVEEATQALDEILKRSPKHRPWVLVPVYGLASACVGPFGFKARMIDLPILFLLGSILGFLQLIVAPKSEYYANVFEISAAIVTSFLARAFGSIRNGNLFCFSALAQASIALILPGYIICKFPRAYINTRLLIFLCSMWRTRATIQEYSCWLGPYVLCHYIFALLRVWNYYRLCSIWSGRLKCNIFYDM